MKTIRYILILFLLYSCTKGGGNVYVEGRAYNPITGEGIPNVEIALCRDKLGGAPGFQSGGVKVVKRVSTDANGYYQLKYSGVNNYFIRLMKLGDYAGIGWANIHTNKKEYSSKGADFKVYLSKNTHADFHAVPYGELKMHIKNIACFNQLDYVEIYFDGESVNSKTFLKGLINTKVGCLDVLDSPVKSSMGYKYFHWIANKGGVVTTYYDTVFVEANQTTILNIFY